MNFLPKLEEVKKIADTGKYKVLPVSCEILSDICTPIEALKILKNISTHCYMLESVAEKEKWGRYTFLGYDPKLEITCINGQLKAGEISIKTDEPDAYLRQILSEYKSPRFDYLPSFTGGLVGYFSYDYLAYSEPSVKMDVEDDEFKDIDLMLFDKVIAFDNFRQKIILIANMPLDDPETGYNKAIMELKQMAQLLRTGEKKHEPGGHLKGEVTSLFNKEEYCSMVEKAKEYIREGDIFQIVLSNRLSAPFEGSLLNTYRILRTLNPSPYMFYFSGTDVEVAGASPETLVKLENNKRGIYGGAIGYIDLAGNMDTCIAIRIAYKKNGRVFVRSGAGIVADSVPENEYQECINKAQAVISALKQAEGRIYMSNIKSAFENGKAFIPFITCGDPDLETTAAAVREMVRAGADLIELGIPFSDPTAEGPVIQAANIRALSGGVTTDKIFDMVRELRRDVKIPMVFMTYANVVFSYGAEKFISLCDEVGIDGLILPDLPFEEKEEFLYVVSSLGVTGTRSAINTNLGRMVELVRENTDIPCAIGFGISMPQQAAKMAGISDGAIVGSAIIKILEKYGKDAPVHIGEYVKSMKDAVSAAG